MNRLTFRTAFGGPAVSSDYSVELARIKNKLEEIEFSYDLDMSLNIGGDLIRITDLTGLKSVRIEASKKKAKGLIQLNSQDVLSAKQPKKFLRTAISDTMTEMFARIAKKDADFSVTDAQVKLDFLTE